jgi:hypothetical protein
VTTPSPRKTHFLSLYGEFVFSKNREFATKYSVFREKCAAIWRFFAPQKITDWNTLENSESKNLKNGRTHFKTTLELRFHLIKST